MQVSNRELLHAVVALYAVSLSEMTPDTLYASVCEKWARTIVLLRDVSGENMDVLWIRLHCWHIAIVLKFVEAQKMYAMYFVQGWASYLQRI